MQISMVESKTEWLLGSVRIGLLKLILIPISLGSDSIVALVRKLRRLKRRHWRSLKMPGGSPPLFQMGSKDGG